MNKSSHPCNGVYLSLEFRFDTPNYPCWRDYPVPTCCTNMLFYSANNFPYTYFGSGALT